MMVSDVHCVVFDGTSAFVCGLDDVDQDCEVIAKFYDLASADRFCDKQNDHIMDRV